MRVQLPTRAHPHTYHSCCAPGQVLHAYTYLGSYKDTDNRASRYGPHEYGYTVATCSQACSTYKFFALQDTGWCSCDNDWGHITKYGTAASDCNPLGGTWCSAVYSHIGDVRVECGINPVTERLDQMPFLFTNEGQPANSPGPVLAYGKVAAYTNETVAEVRGYIKIGDGKCALPNGVEPKFHWLGRVVEGQSQCADRCTDRTWSCFGFSISSANNCLLWLEGPLSTYQAPLTNEQSWGDATCMAKSPPPDQHSELYPLSWPPTPVVPSSDQAPPRLRFHFPGTEMSPPFLFDEFLSAAIGNTTWVDSDGKVSVSEPGPLLQAARQGLSPHQLWAVFLDAFVPAATEFVFRALFGTDIVLASQAGVMFAEASWQDLVLTETNITRTQYFSRTANMQNAFLSLTANCTRSRRFVCDECGVDDTGKATCCGKGGSWMGTCIVNGSRSFLSGYAACTSSPPSLPPKAPPPNAVQMVVDVNSRVDALEASNAVLQAQVFQLQTLLATVAVSWTPADKGNHWCGRNHPGQATYTQLIGDAFVHALGRGNWTFNNSQNGGWHFCNIGNGSRQTSANCKIGCFALGEMCAELTIAENGCCFPAAQVCIGDYMENADKYIVSAQ